MAKLKNVRDTWDEYGGWVILLVVAYFLWMLRKVFQTGSDTLQAKLDAATAEARNRAEADSNKAKVKASTGTTREPSDEEIAKWTADAATFAAMLDINSNFSFERRPADAFSLIKKGYSRLLLYNNKPYYFKPGTIKNGRGQIVSQNAETAASVKNATNWKVLVPFYKEATNGRDLLKDMRLYFTDSAQKALLKWII
jgi:hypothetical protein